MNFFDKVPTISYNGYTVKNIFARASISESTRGNRLIYYPYTIKEEDRIDTISNNYYDSPGYMWLIWMSNDMIDPYFDMPLTDIDFQQFIETKYGSVDTARSTVKCYRNNWYTVSGHITIDQYNALPYNYYKYYDPMVGMNYEIMAYTRKQYDDVVSTNMSIGVTMASNINYNVDDIFKIDDNNYGYVALCSGNYLVIQHITGAFAPASIVDGVTISDVVVLAQTIAWTDSLYWEQVSNYDYEHELNEAKKSIYLIDARYRDTVESELQSVLNT